MQTAETSKIHPWEAAGLGVAPYRCLGVERRVGPIRQIGPNGEPTGLEIGAPGQPMGVCDACGQGIADCYIIRSADGKKFVVGCDCVEKVARGSVSPLERDFRRHRLALEHARDDARIAAAVEMIGRPEVAARLSAMPPQPQHRQPWPGETALTWVLWCFEHAGRAGKIRAARVVERAAST